MYHIIWGLAPLAALQLVATPKGSTLGDEARPRPHFAVDRTANDESSGPGREIPRTVLALYDGAETPKPRFSNLHTRAELPLNYLGLVVRYHDVYDGLPTEADLEGVRGVITWFHSTPIADAAAYARWAERLVSSNRKLVVIGDPGVDTDSSSETAKEAVVDLWRLLGLRSEERWENITYDIEVTQTNATMVGFERPLDTLLPGYPVMRALPSVESHLVVQRRQVPSSRSVLIATGPRGGFIAPSYALYDNEKGTVQWYVDPFEFFRLAFATDDLPKPDATTVAGRRIFYSHIDGDGWRNLSEIADYQRRGSAASEVVLEQVIEQFRDLPVTVAPIAGDLDPEWFGNGDALRVARRIFAQPHVEAGTHTYSHPLDWSYFAPDAVRNRGQARSSYSVVPQSVRRFIEQLGLLSNEKSLDRGWNADTYERPRAYELKPFDLDFEIRGSVGFIERLLPRGKRVEIMQWSGNTTPFEAAIEAARAIGLSNINGGDSRLDTEFPSYAWVAPAGRIVGDELHVYASNSNENTYTDLWTDRFFGFKHLVTTLQNTESPRRVKPFNVYYHMYSGEKLPSLIAVQDNLREARRQRLAPISTSHYARIVEGFFHTRVVEVGNARFRIEDRGALNTLAFDAPEGAGIDWRRSRGVVGQKRHQGRLYVALDATIRSPVVALSRMSRGDATSFLVESRWNVFDVERHSEGVSYRAQGFGPGEVTWSMARPGTYHVRALQNDRFVFETTAETSVGGLLGFTVPASAIDGLRILVRRLPGAFGEST